MLGAAKSFEDIRENLEILHLDSKKDSSQTYLYVLRQNRLDLGGPLNTTQAKARILFVDHTAERGGGEIALLRMIRNMDHDRVTPIVLL